VARNTARAVPAELADVPARGDPQLAADGVTCRRGSPRAPRHAGPARPGGLDEQVAGALLNLPAATVRTLLSRPGAASKRRGGMNQDWPVANPRPGPPDAGHLGHNPRASPTRKHIPAPFDTVWGYR